MWFSDVAEGRIAATLTLAGTTAGEGVSGLAFDHDGKTLYTAGERGIEVWDVTPASRALVVAAAASPGQERTTLRGHVEIVRSLAVFDNGKALATRASDGTVKVWDVRLGRVRLTLGSEESRILCMGISPDGRWLAAGVRVSPSPLTPPAPAPPERADEPAAEGGNPVSSKNSRPRARWSSQPAPPAKPATAPPSQGSPAMVRHGKPRCPPHQTPVQRPSPSAPPTVEAKVWSLDNGHERATLTGHNGAVVALEFSPDGKTLATTSRAGVVKLWDTRTFQVKLVPIGRQASVDLVQFSADGKTLVGANAAGLVTLWDVETGNARADFQHPGGMNMIVLSPDGKILATGGSRVRGPARRGPARAKSGSGRSPPDEGWLSCPCPTVGSRAWHLHPTAGHWRPRLRPRLSCSGTSPPGRHSQH